jgi:hypothetical protein
MMTASRFDRPITVNDITTFAISVREKMMRQIPGPTSNYGSHNLRSRVGSHHLGLG